MLSSRSGHPSRLLIALLLALITFSYSGSAHAYAWMIRHDYTACAACHTDPSGAGLLTEYGRGLSDLVLRTRYGQTDEEPGKSSEFAFGLVKPPSWLNLGGQLRTLFLETKIASAKATPSFFLMQADLQAEARVRNFRLNVSLGVSPTDGSAAKLVGPLVSREHWLGYATSNESLLVRVGHLNLPFGIRSIEHELFVRKATQTDLNDTQQDGVALAYNGDSFRFEALAIAGNYQLRHDANRQRGYSLMAEVAPLRNLALGVSSLITHAAQDRFLNEASTRQAHGLSLRWAPWLPLVLLGEADLLVRHTPSSGNLVGSATMLQADTEPVQGLHFMLTGETYTPGKQAQSYSGWFGVAWFFAPHADVRVDAMRQSYVVGTMRLPVTAGMAQFHVFL